MKKIKTNTKILCIISGILLILAIPTGWAYDFYVLLRWIIFITSTIIAYDFYKSKLLSWTWIFGALAFLFNPILPIYLNKSNWVFIDFIGAILFFITAYSFRKKKL